MCLLTSVTFVSRQVSPDASNQIVALASKCFAAGVVDAITVCVRLLWFSTGDSALDIQQVADSRIRLLNCEQLLNVFQQKAQESVAKFGHQQPSGDAVRILSVATPPPCALLVMMGSQVLSRSFLRNQRSGAIRAALWLQL